MQRRHYLIEYALDKDTFPEQKSEHGMKPCVFWIFSTSLKQYFKKRAQNCKTYQCMKKINEIKKINVCNPLSYYNA